MPFKFKDLIIKVESAEGPIVVFCEGASCEEFSGCHAQSGCQAQSDCHGQSGRPNVSGCVITACTDTKTKDTPLESAYFDELQGALQRALGKLR